MSMAQLGLDSGQIEGVFTRSGRFARQRRLIVCSMSTRGSPYRPSASRKIARLIKQRCVNWIAIA